MASHMDDEQRLSILVQTHISWKNTLSVVILIEKCKVIQQNQHSKMTIASSLGKY